MVLLDAAQVDDRRQQPEDILSQMDTHAVEYQAHGLSAGAVSIWIPRSMISVPELMMICLSRSVADKS